MAYEKGSRPEGGFKRRGPVRRRKKVCVFCAAIVLVSLLTKAPSKEIVEEFESV